MNSATCEWMDGWMDGRGQEQSLCLVLGVFEGGQQGIMKERRVRNVIKATFNICIYLALLLEAKPIRIKLFGLIPPKLPPL